MTAIGSLDCKIARCHAEPATSALEEARAPVGTWCRAHGGREGETAAARGGEGDYPLSIPLRIGHQQTEVGTLLVGPRPDGSVPGKDERDALEEIADPIARAMRIVGIRDAEQVERLTETDGLRTAIVALGARLDQLETKAT